MAEHLREKEYPNPIPEEVIFRIPNRLPENIRRIKYRQLQLICDKDARVLQARSDDAKMALDILDGLDHAIGVVQRKVVQNPEQAVSALIKARGAIMTLNEVAIELSRLYGLQYKIPRGLRDKPEDIVPAAGLKKDKHKKRPRTEATAATNSPGTGEIVVSDEQSGRIQSSVPAI